MAFKRQPLQTQVLRTPWDPIWLWQYRGPFQEHRQHGMGLSGLELQYSQFGDVSWALSWLTKDTPTAFNSMIFQLLGSSPTYMIQTKAAAIFSRTIHPAFLLQQGAAMMNPRRPGWHPAANTRHFGPGIDGLGALGRTGIPLQTQTGPDGHLGSKRNLDPHFHW